MIDPVTALATASAAFNMIKKGFEVGRDIESMASDIGRFMGAVSDIDKSAELAKKPPIFKKLIASKSVEQEALEAFMAKQKAQDMRDDLRKLISWTRGPSAWQELIRMEADIRKQRQQMIYAQQERRRKVVEGIAIVVLIALASAVILGMLYVGISYRKGM